MTAASRDAVDRAWWRARNDPDHGRSAGPSCAQDRVRTFDQDTQRRFPGRRLPEMVLLLWCGLNKPVFEAGVEVEGVRTGKEYAFLEEGTRVASLGVGNDLSRVSSKAQVLGGCWSRS